MVNVAGRAIAEAQGRARAYVEANMRNEVLITRGAEPVLLATGEVDADVDSIQYEGRARMGPAGGPVTYTIGEEVQFFSSASCSIPVVVDDTPVDVQVNDLLMVTGHDDPGMVGRKFRVTDVEGEGVLVAVRRLQLVGIQHYAGWEDEVLKHPVSGPPVPDVVPPEWRVD